MKILITHNILWSKYKGGVFSALHHHSLKSEFDIEFLHIAETENARVGLAGVDLSYHQYPYQLLFKGSYDDVPKWLLIKTLFFFVWRTHADIVILAGYHLAEYWAMLLAARLRGKQIAVFCDSTAYDHPHTFLKSLLKRFFFSHCDIFFGYGQRAREYLMSLGVSSEKIYFRCQAAALPHDYDMQSVISYRNSKTNVTPRYLYVGRLSPEKNLDDLFQAFKKVVSLLPDAIIVIVGNGPHKEHLVSLAEHLELSSSILFAGAKNTDELSIEYLDASCMVLPSSSEPWGLVVNEALSYGCPVVVSHRCGCVPELVIDGKTGFVYECGNVDELANKMIDAHNTFSNLENHARELTSFISTFSPETAASQILVGCSLTSAKK